VTEIGKRDRYLRIEQRSTSQDASYGTPLDVWTEYVTLWAEVQDVLPSRGESQGSGINIAQRPARVRTGYVSGITAAMRAVDLTRGNRVLAILTQPVELGNQAGLEFMVGDFTTAGNAK
jgi:head-tail adaptor